MAQVINTNVASLNAQRNLNTSQTSLATSLQRLSSGLRINSAKDDAAGLAISERFTTQIRGLNQATRNSNDGISLAQTGEGALAEITSNLQRIRELAVQSANATNSASDRAALDLEVQQRIAEIERTATQTSFNGQKILDGTFGTASFQVGANVGETISVGLSTSMRSSAIGKTADYVSGTAAYDSSKALGAQGAGVTTNALTSGGVTIAIGSAQAVGVVASAAGTAAGQAAASAWSKAAAINASGISGLTATADTSATFTFVTAAASATANDTYSLKINDVAIYTNAATSLAGSDVASAINANSSATGVTATFDSSAGRMTLTSSEGRDVKIEQTTGSAAGAGEGFVALAGNNNTVNTTTGSMSTGTGATVSKTYAGTLRLTAAESITVGGASVADIGYTATSLALGTSALNNAKVTTVSEANTTITRVDAALASVSTLRSTFGAIHNRFESVISNLQATSENLSASRSRIQDADFASETANLTRAQILQQSGIAMLGQANALPNNVLSLLR